MDTSCKQSITFLVICRQTSILMRGGIENQNVLSLLECHSYSIYYCDRAKVVDVLSYYVIIWDNDTRRSFDAFSRFSFVLFLFRGDWYIYDVLML